MHPASLREMDRILGRLEGRRNLLVLDVGGRDINGSYRELVEGRKWTYISLDVEAGKNVDVVAADPYSYPFPDGTFDVVISGSVMEHIARPWAWIKELARLLVPGGMLALVTHHTFPEHRHPIDCYRYMPDGLRALLDEAGCLEHYEINKLDEPDGTISALAWRL